MGLLKLWARAARRAVAYNALVVVADALAQDAEAPAADVATVQEDASDAADGAL